MNTQRKQYRKGIKRQDDILEQARRLFSEQGYSEFSMRKVAAAVGITIGNLHYYFPSKESLLLALYDRVEGEYRQAFRQARDGAGDDPEAQLKAVLGFLLTDTLADESYRVMAELWALRHHEPRINERYNELYKIYVDYVSTTVLKINPQLTPRRSLELAILFASTMDGLLLNSGLNKPFMGDIQAVRELAIDHFMRMINWG